MKTIYIVRHAKSSWDFPHLSDHERPLIEKGKKRTKLINKYLTDNKITVDMMLSSHATRAIETAGIIARAIAYPKGLIRIDPMIYHTTSDRIAEQFYDLSDDIKSAMLVGHNPTLTNFVNDFIDPKIDWLPTSAVVCLQFEADKWVNLSMAKHRTIFLITPRMLKNKKNRDGQI
jgi:phosphohistidine phosphatase